MKLTYEFHFALGVDFSVVVLNTAEKCVVMMFEQAFLFICCLTLWKVIVASLSQAVFSKDVVAPIAPFGHDS